VRVDSGVRAGSVVSDSYDPMLAKLVVWDADREQATARMLRALGEYRIEGLKTLIGFHRALLATEQWARGETCRDLLEDREWLKALAFAKPPARDGDGAEETIEQTYTVEVSGRKFDVRVIGPAGGPAGAADANGAVPAAPKRPARAAREPRPRENGHGGDALNSPMQGSVWKIAVKAGQRVVEGEVVTIIEAMKMENEITAHKAGVISELPISEGDLVRSGDVLAVITDP
jgi:acetyl-CoA/propionyl-CoA carboxylase biotin carboxyl carrier protein